MGSWGTGGWGGGITAPINEKRKKKKKDRRLEKGLQKALSDKCKSWQHGQMLAGRGQKTALHVTAAQNKEESSIFGA